MYTTKQLAQRFVGTWEEHKESFRVAFWMLVVTGFYEFASKQFSPDYVFNIYEFVGTWTGLVCVWLSRTQNVLCWPWGILSSLALGVFFSQIDLPGQQWLNWGYFAVIQLWAWPYWVFGGEQHSELQVTTMTWAGRVVAIGAIVIGTGIVYKLIGLISPGSFHPVLDSLVVASSVVAQYLLGKKKVESWFFWLGPVNLVSIALFFAAGAYTLTALYIAFFIHAFFALIAWNRTPAVVTSH